VAASPRVVQAGEPVPKGGGNYRVGRPYVVAGQTYVPEENENFVSEGLASWYGADFHGRLTANREVYDMEGISAAHPTLPMPSYVRVTNLRNKRSLIVRVNDRGPYHANRVIDLSVGAAKLLGFHEYGVARVRVEYVGRAALAGSDDQKLTATLRHGTPAPAPSVVMVAAAKPFIPDRAGPALVPSRVATTREAAPPPPSYGLASSRSQPVAAPAPRVVAAAERSQSFNDRFAPIAAAPLPAVGPGNAAAFAPSWNGAVMTGRGLY